MIFFVIYAIAVWGGAVRWRRRCRGFACVLAGLAGLVAFALFHIQLGIWTHGRIFVPVFQSILFPYIALVTAVGFYIACLPTREQVAARAHGCGRCGYDVTGLHAAADPRCPECGRMLNPPESARPVGVGSAAPMRRRGRKSLFAYRTLLVDD